MMASTNTVDNDETMNTISQHEPLFPNDDNDVLENIHLSTLNDHEIDTTNEDDDVESKISQSNMQNQEMKEKDDALHSSSFNSSSFASSSRRWISDEEVLVCKACGLLFDWARRKHHCRLCGHIFCDLCTSQRALISMEMILNSPDRQYLSVNGHNPQRVCDTCSTELLPQQEQLRSTCSNAVQPNALTETGSKRFLNSPYSFSLREEIRKAAYSVENFMYAEGIIKDQSIPLPLLANAKGLAFLTVVKAGFVFSGRLGTGLVIARRSDHTWSAPSAIGTMGFGWGAQIGGEVTDFVLILNTQSAVDLFAGEGQIKFGAELGMAAGPVGRVAAGSIDAGLGGISPCYSYSHSKGLFIGVSLEGSVVATRPEVNQSFYGKTVTVRDLLSGVEPAPNAAAPLYEALRKAIESPANAINRFSYPAPPVSYQPVPTTSDAMPSVPVPPQRAGSYS